MTTIQLIATESILARSTEVTSVQRWGIQGPSKYRLKASFVPSLSQLLAQFWAHQRQTVNICWNNKQKRLDLPTSTNADIYVQADSVKKKELTGDWPLTECSWYSSKLPLPSPSTPQHIPSCLFTKNPKACNLLVRPIAFRPWRRAWQSTPYSCLENPHGQRSLVGYRPWGLKESDVSERPNTHCLQGPPRWPSGKESACQHRRHKKLRSTRVQSLGQEEPLEEEIATHSSILAWNTEYWILLLEYSGAWQGYSPGGRKKSDFTERLNTHTHLQSTVGSFTNCLFISPCCSHSDLHSPPPAPSLFLPAWQLLVIQASDQRPSLSWSLP